MIGIVLVSRFFQYSTQRGGTLKRLLAQAANDPWIYFYHLGDIILSLTTDSNTCPSCYVTLLIIIFRLDIVTPALFMR